ncbi:hypothetical protein R1flu_003081 [Riccia fluitans]|uniref:Uncharacterized protein n=1 Tax=Riccia fluitans TaxID=41844 RepID=A0ABD1Y8B7_9MARC
MTVKSRIDRSSQNRTSRLTTIFCWSDERGMSAAYQKCQTGRKLEPPFLLKMFGDRRITGAPAHPTEIGKVLFQLHFACSVLEDKLFLQQLPEVVRVLEVDDTWDDCITHSLCSSRSRSNAGEFRRDVLFVLWGGHEYHDPIGRCNEAERGSVLSAREEESN